MKWNTQKFIEKSKELFGDKFDYSKVKYQSTKKKVIIICPIHGEFEQSPETHLKSKCGCPKCVRELPRKEIIPGIKRKEMREYNIWRGMKTRVTNPNIDDANRYINRGITCCEEWLNSFEQFYKDMGPCPDGYSIDRIDPNGNYCPENCRWTNQTTQCQNRGEFNKVYTYNGETHVLKEWARILNIKYTTLYQRINRSGMSFEEAINRTEKDNLTEFNGEYKTLKEWCNIYNIKYSTVITRLNKHKWTLEEALLTPYGQKRRSIEI